MRGGERGLPGDCSGDIDKSIGYQSDEGSHCGPIAAFNLRGRFGRICSLQIEHGSRIGVAKVLRTNVPLSGRRGFVFAANS